MILAHLAVSALVGWAKASGDAGAVSKPSAENRSNKALSRYSVLILQNYEKA
jgi:hypothetical protein